MLTTMSRNLSRAVERWVPGPFFLAVLLTFVVGIMALLLTPTGPRDLILAWGDGLAGLLAFMTQICLVLLLGYTLAHTRPVHLMLIKVASLPRSSRQAYGFVALVGAVASLISFGLGLIVAGVMAVEVARVFRDRGRPLHYPLLVAAGYSGFVVWHMGYSGSGPLNAATEGGAYTDMPGGLVPVSETTFATFNIVATVLTVVVLVGAMMLLAPKDDDTEIVPAPEVVFDDPLERLEQVDEEGARETGPAAVLDSLRAVTLAMGVLLGLYLVFYYMDNGFQLTLDIVNWSFLCLVLLLVGNARELAALVADGGRTVSEVLLQYPLYAGIIGMMGASGLVDVISQFFIDIATPATLGLFTFLAAGVLNMFVPSGGGQFALTAPLFGNAADALGVDQSVVIMAVAYGDQWTNMIQPFWAIPLLAVAGLKVRDILGYTTITLVLTGIVFAGTLLVIGAG